MRKFLIKLGKFGSILIIVIAVLSIGNYFLLKKFYTPRNIISTNSLVLGDSHAATGVDPGKLKSCVNFAIHSEHPFYTFYKLKWLIDSNTSVKRVIFTLAHHNLVGDAIVKSEGWQVDKLPLYLPITPVDSLLSEVSLNKTIMKNVLIYKLGLIHSTTLELSFKSAFTEIGSSDFPFLGKYLNKNSSNKNLGDVEIDKSILNHYSGKVISINNIGIRYLKKSITYCRNKKITPIILITPLNYRYKEKIPDDIKIEFDKLLVQIKEDSIKVLDLSSMPISDSGFGDGSHLNSFGSSLFSPRLNELIEEIN